MHMKTFQCSCGQDLFFDNSMCLRCQAKLGFCPACYSIAPLLPQPDGSWRCGHPACNVRLALCHNYRMYDVCNRCVLWPDAGIAEVYCDCCRYNYTIPDLSVAGNIEKWGRLEAAKRRLFYDLDLLRLPRGTRADGVHPPLSFDFKADDIPATDMWWTAGSAERVYTGHSKGHITINIMEADEVERVRLRVDLGEAHRTLIGHFRHEIGHYYWDVFIKGQLEPAFEILFGSPYEPAYDIALEQYYAQGPAANWSSAYISAYASMHPWEDWAETFAFYLDMVSALDTAAHNGLMTRSLACFESMEKMAMAYQRLGVGLNEMSRTLGLIDMVPEVITQRVLEKLDFIYARCPPIAVAG